MIFSSIFYVLLAALFNVIGNLFLKQHALTVNKELNFFLQILSFNFLFSILFFGLNLIAFSKALELTSINIAYPILIGVSIILIILLSAILFKESLNLYNLFGLIFIITGILLAYIK